MENLIDFMDSNVFWFPVMAGSLILLVFIIFNLLAERRRLRKSIKTLEFTKDLLYEEQHELKKDNAFYRNLIEVSRSGKMKPSA